MLTFWITVAIFISIFLLLGYNSPKQLQIELDKVRLYAPRDKLYEVLSTPALHTGWHPWTKGADCCGELTFFGPEQGTGGGYKWNSPQRVVGAGTMTICDAVAPQRIVMGLDYGKGQKATSSWILEPMQDGCALTWRYQTEAIRNPAARLLVPLAASLMRSALRDALTRLKAAVEQSNEMADDPSDDPFSDD